MKDIIAIGNSPVDILTHVDDDLLTKYHLKKGDYQSITLNTLKNLKSECTITRSQPGGSIANTAYHMAKLGSKVGFIGHFGVDEAGMLFENEMVNAGVIVTPGIHGSQTTEILTLITPDGERTFATIGITSHISPAMIDEETISNSRWLLIEGYLFGKQYEAAKKAMNIARKHGVKIALTMASESTLHKHFDEISTEIENGVNLIIANNKELKTLIESAEDSGHAIINKIHSTPRIITSSGDGATYSNAKKPITVPTIKVSAPVDTTGAGDSFAAGFLHYYINKHPIDDAIKFGHTLASKVIMQTGARLHDDLSFID
jgi:sugar/nucleoside kinase (ribokinase family)